MSVEVGTLFGHYKVIAMLGQGGMGAVYKARDTRLDRTVAIKVLQEPRPDRRLRFVREARAIASLQHPHICTLHDVGSEDAVDYLVMEHVDGEILTTPLPLPRVIEYGIQIAGALEAAHSKNITHRDLKPANIMVTKSGVKVLDFSIASVSGEDTLTADGAVIGTPAYMAPEQRGGRPTDARTDIYALGLVLVEMTTGRNDPRQTIEPPALDRIVRGCLAEQPDDRWQSAHDVRRLLQEVDLAPAPVAAPRRRWPWLIATAVTAVAASGAAWLLKPAQPSPTYQLSIAPPRGSAFLMARNREGGLALSPDGSMIAFVARTGARVELWTERLDSGEARPIPGTEHAIYPFWSPDSRQIAFYTPDSLKRVPLDGGPVRTIAPSEPRRVAGGAWLSGDVLLVTGRAGGGIHRISVHGGDSQLIEAGGGWPHALPDGRGFLYASAGGIYAGSIDAAGKGRRLLEVKPTQVVYSDGHLLFVRDRILVAQSFDPKSSQVSGEAFPVAHSLLVREPGESTHDVAFSATHSGVLAYAAGEAPTRLRWRSRSGKAQGEVGEPGEYLTPRVSPDGRRVAFARRESGNLDLWVAAADGTSIVRLTFDPVIDWYPIWSPDGQTITFSSGPTSAPSPTYSAEALDLFRKAADGTGRAEQLTFDKGPQHAMDWSSDGRFLSFTRNSPDFGTDLRILPAFDQRKPYEFLRTNVSEAHSQFDPGKPARWIAYSSDESGRREIYVAGFVPGEPASQARWQVSREGGTFPRWRRDGKELYYWGLDGRIMAVAVDGSGSAFRTSAPVALFQVQTPTLRTTAIEYDVTPDGQRFLMIEPAEQTTFQSLSLSTNWRAATARNR